MDRKKYIIYTSHPSSDPLGELLARLTNVRPAGPGRYRATCPAHGTGRNQALSIALAGDKLLIHCFAGCRAEEVLAALGLSWRDLYADCRPWERPDYFHPPPTPEAELQARWSRWWDKAQPGHELLVRYLRARGFSIEPPPSLRLAAWGEPMMLARVLDVRGGLIGLHLTRLARDGSAYLGKRLAKGSRPAGGAIRLYPLEAGRPLALAEGIETALAVREISGLPTWACVSAGGLERVELPLGPSEIVIAADHDEAGLEAAQRLARRLLGEGRRVRLALPPAEGADWLDVLVSVRGRHEP